MNRTNQHLECNKSFNKGERYLSLLEESVKKLGLTRSIVVDNSNNILCGNKVANICNKIGINKIRFIETSGDELIVVKRTDVEPNTTKSYEISLVDNIIANKNLDWDVDLVLETVKQNLSFNPLKWGGHECVIKELNIEEFLKDEVVRQSRVTKEKKDNYNMQQISLFE